MFGYVRLVFEYSMILRVRVMFSFIIRKLCLKKENNGLQFQIVSWTCGAQPEI